MIVIGSFALECQGVSFREPKDIDVFSTSPVTMKGRLDVQIIPESVYDLIPIVKHGYLKIATPDSIFTIKCSHLPWDVHGVSGIWEKHYRDIQYLKRIGCKLIEPLYEALMVHWIQKNGDKPFLNMEQSKEEFFTDHVKYVYDHDYLHGLLAYPNTPIYKQCVEDGQEVSISKELFEKLSFQNQVEFFRQEIGVIAVERWLVHAPMPLVTAWTLAVKKTITTLTKSWMSEFIVRNIEWFTTPNRNNFIHLFNTLNIKETNMTQLTNEQVQALIEEITEYTGAFSSWDKKQEHPSDWNIYDFAHGDLALKEDAPYEHIEQDGGGEGGAEYCKTIFKWKDEFYKVTYSYASYQGFDFDYASWYKVSPKEKTITVYE